MSRRDPYQRTAYVQMSMAERSAFRLGVSTARRDDLMLRARWERSRGNHEAARLCVRSARWSNSAVVCERQIMRSRATFSEQRA